MHNIMTEQSLVACFTVIQILKTYHMSRSLAAHSVQHVATPQCQYDHAAPNETMACETMRDHVNINSVCKVM